MKYIELTQGKYTAVDDGDFDWLNQWSWLFWPSTTGRTGYAARRRIKSKGGGVVRMHNVLLLPTDGLTVDHEDGDGLNNQRDNLRLATHQQNCMNRRTPCNNTSGYKGVWRDKERNLWVAQIQRDGKSKKLGRFFCIVKAAKTYDTAARELFGKFARTNF